MDARYLPSSFTWPWTRFSFKNLATSFAFAIDFSRSLLSSERLRFASKLLRASNRAAFITATSPGPSSALVLVQISLTAIRGGKEFTFESNANGSQEIPVGSSGGDARHVGSPGV